jgi:hypothetical protein
MPSKGLAALRLKREREREAYWNKLLLVEAFYVSLRSWSLFYEFEASVWRLPFPLWSLISSYEGAVWEWVVRDVEITWPEIARIGRND